MERFRKSTVISWFFAALIISAVLEPNLEAKGMRVATDRDVVYIT